MLSQVPTGIKRHGEQFYYLPRRLLDDASWQFERGHLQFGDRYRAEPGQRNLGYA
jgi:hypothetical protein